MTVCEIYFKLKFSKFILNIKTLIVFGKFLLIVQIIFNPNVSDSKMCSILEMTPFVIYAADVKK